MKKDEYVVLKYYKSKTGVTDTYNEIEVNCALGKFRYKDSKKEISIAYCQAYPEILPTIKGKQIHLKVHVAILSSSSPKLPMTGGFVVDHKDRDKQNFKLSNLRFVTISENNKNISPRQTSKIGILVTNNKIKYIYKNNKDERFSDKFEQFKRNKSFDKALSMTEYTYNQITKKDINLSIIDILDNISWTKIDNSNYEISNLGVARRKFTYGYHYTIGTLYNTGYLCLTIKSRPTKSKSIQSLVVKYFINGGKDYSLDLQVDHIDTNPLNNRVENLRLVTGKENMNNLITKKKKYVPIKCIYKGEKKYFKNRLDCSKFLLVSRESVRNWINKTSTPSNPNYSNFEKVTEDELRDLESRKLKFTEVS